MEYVINLNLSFSRRWLWR